MQEHIKESIDVELQEIQMTESLKNNVRKRVIKKYYRWNFKFAVTAMAIFLLSGTTVFAAYYLHNKVNINEEALPELNEMSIIGMDSVKYPEDEYGMIEKDFDNYNALQEELGIKLLDTEFSTDNPYMQGHLMTDNKDFCIITVDNYILGDTSNYQYFAQENRYLYEAGKEYISPISLSADIILSEEQMKNGWDTDYLGMYEFVENFVSENGYKVNLVQSTNGDDEIPEGFVSEKCAVFVVDGIRYTLKGRTSVENIKEIINAMQK